MALTEIPIELSSTPGIVDNSNATAITIDSSENVGIGTSPARPLHVSTSGVIPLRLTSTGTDCQIELGNSGGTPIIGSFNDQLIFKTASTERMRLDASGNASIGTSSAFGKLRVEDTGWSSGSPYGTVAYILGGDVNDANWGHLLVSQSGTTTGSGGKISFGADGANPIAGIKAYYAGATYGHLDFYTRPSGGTSTQRMRIDSSGNLNVVRSAYTSASTNGFHANADGWTHTSASNEPVAYFNRNTSDGDVIRILKAGTTVGSIATEGGDMAIGNDDAGIQFVNGTEHFRPFNMTTNAATDALMDIGSSTKRFKDLHLSGNAYADNLIGTNDGDTFIAMTGSNVMRFFTGNSEAARFDASGNLLVGLTSISDATSRTYGNAFSGTSANPNWKSWGSGSHTHAQFRNGTSAVGSITSTSSATAYNTSSDQRLKDNIVDAPSASDDIDAIQVRSFDWKADGSHQKYGMVAQELQTVAPEAVSAPENPEEMMGVDYSKLVPMLVKEIQSLRARVAQLES